LFTYHRFFFFYYYYYFYFHFQNLAGLSAITLTFDSLDIYRFSFQSNESIKKLSFPFIPYKLMRSQQINHRYSFPPLLTMNTVQSKPLLPEQNRPSTDRPDDQLVDICTKYIPSSLFVPKDKLEPFESPLTESNLKFHTTIVSTISLTVISLPRNTLCVCVFMLVSSTLDIGTPIRLYEIRI
jgi:hypothetical protein